MTNPIDTKLDDIALRQFCWKNKKLLTACLLIAEKACERVTFYPDELVFDFLLTEDDRNCIGSAWRMCAKTLGIIQKTGNYRRSSKEDQNGRMIWQYTLASRSIAEAFLRRYDVDAYKKASHPQLNLGL